MNTARRASAITPHDTTLLAAPINGIYCGGAGNITVLNRDGTTALFVGVPVGTLLPIDAKRINATGTTATNLVGLVS